jgi:TP901 family phage tail tape measure protein
VANEVNANIRVNLDTADAAAQLRAFETQISAINQRISQSNKKAIQQQQAAVSMFQSQLGNFGDFSTSIKNVETSVSRFTTSLEKGKLSFGEYFRYGAASTKKFGKFFGKELDTINAVAEERVKKLSTRYIALGKQAEGTQKLLAIRPTQLTSGLDTQLAMTAQKQQIFNKLLQQGSTHLLNWGKNTQWAGRQLMVGFTIPLTIFGGMASKVFRELETEAINFRKVYGDIFTTDAEVEQNLEAVRGLASEFTKYGKTARETLELAATAAQAGQRGQQLLSATTEATRLSVLGDMNQQEAMKTTISLQSAFRLSTEKLTEAINFMNLVENSSVLTLEDMAGAIPRVAPVIQGLGGTVKEMSVLLVAMKEGGVSAAEGANGLKSSLGRLITPSKQAIDMADKFNISLEKIVETNRGDLLGTLLDLGRQMENLGDLEKQQLLSTIFGKFQFARMGALFDNLIRDGSQAQGVMEAMGMSAADLARTADQELGAVEDSISTKFTASIEQLKLAIAPIGEEFLRAVTPIIQSVTGLLEKFTSLPGGLKTAVVAMIGVIGGIAPVVLMGIGLIANGIANAFKLFNTIRGGYQKLISGIMGANDPLSQSFGYMSDAELEAATAANMLDSNLNALNSTLLIQEGSVQRLTAAYMNLAANMSKIGAVNPQGLGPVNTAARKFARGGSVPGKGDKDTEPALLTPGEFVINKEAANRFRPILEAMNSGMIKGFADGGPVGRQSGNSGVVMSHLAGMTPSELGKTLAQIAEAGDKLGAFGKRVAEAEVTVIRLKDEGNNTYTSIKETGVALSGLAAELLEATSVATGFYKGTAMLGEGQRNQMLSQLPGNPGEPIFPEQLFALERAVNENVSSLGNFTSEIDQIRTEAAQLREALDQSETASLDYTEEKLAAILEAENLRTIGMSAEEAKNKATQDAALIIESMKEIMKRSGNEAENLAKAQLEAIAGLQYFTQQISKAGSQFVLAGEGVSPQASRDIAFGRARAAGDKTAGTYDKPIRVGPSGSASQAGIMKVSSAEWQVMGEEAGIISGEGFRSKFIPIVEQSSLDAGRKVPPNFTKGTDAQSPPPWSLKLGAWIGDGISEGAKQSLANFELMLEDMRRQAEQGQVPGYIPPVPLSSRPGGQPSPAAGGAAAEQNAAAIKDNTKLLNQNNQQQVGFLTGLRKYTYGISGLTFALSYLPGNFQGLSQKIFAVTAAMNALDAVLRIQIISGALKKLQAALIAAAAASGLTAAGKGVSSAVSTGADVAIAASLAKGAGPVGKVGGMFSKLLGPVAKVGAIFTRLVPALGKLALALVRFVGVVVNGIPIVGQIVSALILMTTSLVAFKFAFDHTGNQIRDLGNSAKLTEDSLKSLSEKFGFAARTTGFDSAGTVLGRNEEARSVAEQSREFVSQDQGMQKTVDVLRQQEGTNAEAILRTLFADILASGASKEVAIGIVEAVAKEAGQKKVFIPMLANIEAAFDDEGKIEDFGAFMRDTLKPTINSVEDSLKELNATGNVAFDEKAVSDARRWMAIVDPLPDFIKKALVPQYEQKQAIFETAKSLELLKTSTQTAMNLLSAEFVNGEINVKKFNAGMEEIRSTIASLPENQGLEVLKKQLIELYPEGQENIKSIENLDVAFGILNASAMDVDMSGFIQQMLNAGIAAEDLVEKLNSVAQAQANITGAESRIEKIQSRIDAEKAKPGPKKGDKPTGGGGGGGKKDPFAELENKLRDEQASITIKEIKIDRKAEDMFANSLARRMAQTSITIGDIKIPLKSIADANYAISQIGERIEDIQRGPMKMWENAIKSIEKEIRPYQDRLNDINRDIQLQQQAIGRINREFKPIIDSLSKQKQHHDDILTSLRDQIRAATEPIQDRIDALKMEQRTAERAAKPRLKALEQEEKQMEKQKEVLDDQVESIEKQKETLDEQIVNIDKQRDALGRVQKINEAMVRQQQNMLNLSQAIAEGDIYAATQAAQQMRADSAQQAVDGQQDAFDAQKKAIENEKKALDDRRKAIEEEKKSYDNRKKAIDEEREAIRERIDAIGEETEELEYQKDVIEDSYKFRLREQERLIEAIDREIERNERARDARIEPYQKIIDDYGPQIEDLENFIFDKEKEIEDIRRTQIEPLQEQIDKLNDEKDILEDILGDIELSIKRQKQQLDERKKYLDQELQILSAKREMANLETGGGGGGGGGSAGTEGTRDEDLIKKLEEDLKKQKDILAAAREDLRKAAPDAKPEEGKSFWDNITSWAAGAAASIGGFFNNAWNGVASWVETSVIPAIEGAWNGLVSWFDTNVIQPINTLWTNVSTWFDTNVIQPITGAWNGFIEEVSAIVETFAAFFVAIGQIFDELVIQPAVRAWNQFYADNIQPKIDWFKGKWEEIRVKFDEFIGNIRTAWNQFYADHIEPKIQWLKDTWEDVRSRFGTFITNIQTAWNNFYADHIEPKVNWLKDSWEDVKAKFNEFVDGIRDYWNDFWEEHIQPKIDAFLNLWDDVRGAFVTAFESIGTWWDEWKRLTFDEKVDAMKTGLKSLFDPATWRGWMNDAMTAVRGAALSAINGIIGLFNKISFTVPDWIPAAFGGGKTFALNIPTIKEYAGGEIKRPMGGLIPYSAGEIKRPMGGLIPYSAGGVPGDGGRDSVRALLTPGEFVIRKSMVEKYGMPMMKAINQGAFAMPSYNVPSGKNSSVDRASVNNTASINAPVYNNYDMSFAISGANASADEIANKVMYKIKQAQSQQIRSGRV